MKIIDKIRRFVTGEERRTVASIQFDEMTSLFANRSRLEKELETDFNVTKLQELANVDVLIEEFFDRTVVVDKRPQFLVVVYRNGKQKFSKWYAANDYIEAFDLMLSDTALLPSEHNTKIRYNNDTRMLTVNVD